MFNDGLEPNKAQKYLSYTVLLWLVGTLVGGVISLLFILVFSEGGMSAAIDEPSKMYELASTNTIRWAQILASLFSFVIPVFGALYFLGLRPIKYLGLNILPHLALLSMIAFIVMFFMPLVNITHQLNASLDLPDALQWLEDWIRRGENDANSILLRVLQMGSVGALLLNLLMIGVLPALGEELFFRGMVQKFASRAWANPHIAIIFTAFFFSFIHFQFFGFLPRMLLGIMFGYLYFWTNSLWYPIFAHLIYNGSQVIMAYQLQLQEGAEALSMDPSGVDIPLTTLLLSTVVFFALMAFYQRLASIHHKRILDEY